ncbi:hypothetical protein VNI00_008156 [Paramarasmius palmivorus]|uniref:Uncharacterized protein n=1 Tax=Paramarasmius palmivorus TaxID=297713 RepID=A0AAW0CYC6_9AGAR
MHSLSRRSLSTESLPATPVLYSTEIPDIESPGPATEADQLHFSSPRDCDARRPRVISHKRVRIVVDPSHRSRKSSINSDFSNRTVMIVNNQNSREGPRSRIRQAMTSLFSGRKESAGIIDRNVAPTSRPAKKPTLFAKRVNGTVEAGKGIKQPQKPLTKPSSVFNLRARKVSPSSQKAGDQSTVPIISHPMKLGSHRFVQPLDTDCDPMAKVKEEPVATPFISRPMKLGSHRFIQPQTGSEPDSPSEQTIVLEKNRRRQVRRSRSFSGFQGSPVSFDWSTYVPSSPTPLMGGARWDEEDLSRA